MSELQISLLAIGVFVVLAVYGYSAWQQRRYRSRFGAAFRVRHGDALYQGAAESPGDLPDHLDVEIDQILPGSPSPKSVQDEPCKTLDEGTDYIAVLFASSPLSAGALGPLWHRRFDFGKNVCVCGVGEPGGSWGKVVAESRVSYETFRLALQLADRNGAVSEASLADFRDMLRDIADGIKAEVNLPDVAEAAASARRLDEFCAEVDQMVGMNILPDGEHLLWGSDIAQAAAQHGLTLQSDGAFHLLDAYGHTLFSLGNFDNTPFQHHTMDEIPVIGLSLQLDVPRVEQPARRFDEMAALAHSIGGTLQAAVVDDHRLPLNDAAIAMIRAQVAAIEKRMRAHAIVPGSALARRLFS